MSNSDDYVRGYRDGQLATANTICEYIEIIKDQEIDCNVKREACIQSYFRGLDKICCKLTETKRNVETQCKCPKN